MADVAASPPTPSIRRLSVVVPVYQGERTLDALVSEIEPLTRPGSTPGGRPFQVIEILLVHDGGPDRSDQVIERLAAKHPFIRPVWLSRNFGQHPATLAGMASSTGDWVATLDEDGQHDPADLPKMLDRAEDEGASLVYARPVNPPPHGWIRNLLSGTAKRIAAAILGDSRFRNFHSYRFMRGDIARSLAAYCGQGVFLDVALSWVVPSMALCPSRLRDGGARPSGYSLGSLLRHFTRMILTSGTRPLSLITWTGVLAVLAGLGVTGYVLVGKYTQGIPAPGWASLVIALSLYSGLILFALGVVAQYLALVLSLALGRPLFLVVSRPPGRRGPPA